MITKQSIENLENSIDIVDTISSYIQLRKSGANYKAKCPFHDENTASFTVSPAKQIYHCFGCQAGGGSVKFVMEIEKLNYPEALEKLADQNNITLEYDRNDYQKQDTSIMQKLNDYYVRQLDSNHTATQYLKDRGIWQTTIEKFAIGYASSSDDTINFLKTNMLNLNDAREFGVVDISDTGMYARLIDRIIFPIMTNSGKICGFGGRTITGHMAKYINSPQTKLFNKSKILYGYDKAIQEIHKKKQIIISEGYLDVIMLHQAGWTNTVATMGTALTKEHLPLLSRGEPEVLLAFDGDKAGRDASLKASRLLAQNSFDGSVVLFGDGIDPADMIKDGKTKELSDIFLGKIPFVKFIIDETMATYDISNPYQKKQCLDELLLFLKTLDNIIAYEYKPYLCSKLNIQPQHVRLNNTTRKRENDIPLVAKDIAELSVIKTALSSDEMFDIVVDSLNEDMFSTHKMEFNMLFDEDQNPKLMEISLTDNINTLSTAELNFQITMMTVKHYKTQLIQTKQDLNLSFKQKAIKIKELQKKIKEQLDKK